MAEEEGTTFKTLEDEPKLGPHLHWVWKAFTDLNYRRQAGMGGPLPLTYTDIEAYCRLKAIYSHADRERLLRLIDPLDREYMALAHSDPKRPGQGSPPPPPTHSPPRDRGPRRRTKQVS